MSHPRNYLWNIVLSVLFAALVLYGSHWLMRAGVSFTLPLFDFFLIVLAILRLIRLVTYDAIFRFLREWFTHADPSSLRGTIHTLLNCPWCIGLWFAFFVVFFYYALPIAYPIILVLAVAAVASFFQVLANLIGWHAEGKKEEVLNRQRTRVE